MNLLDILREAWSDTRRQVIPTLLLLIVSLSATAGALVTAGQHMAQQALLQTQLESPSARLITVRENSGALTPHILGLIQNTSTVDSAFGVGDIVEAETPVPGVTVSAWEVTDVTVPYERTTGRVPRDTEAIVDTSLLTTVGWDLPSGSLHTFHGRDIPVVSGATTREGYESFAQSALIQSDNLPSFRTIVIMAKDLTDITDTQNAVRSYLGPDFQGNLTFDNSGLSIVHDMTTGGYAEYARAILMTVIALGSILVSIVALTYVLIFRRTLGRRRALGITRIDLTLVTLARTAIPITIGALIGGIGADVFSRFALSAIPPSFTSAVVALTIIIPCACALPPIVWAANRDPVSVLRTA